MKNEDEIEHILETIKEIAVYLYNKKDTSKHQCCEARTLIQLLTDDEDVEEWLEILNSEYRTYAISQDKERMSDIIRVMWMMEKMMILYSEHKNFKTIKKQFKIIANDLFSYYYSINCPFDKRIDMVKNRIKSYTLQLKECVILFTYPQGDESLHDYIDYRVAIALYKIELPCLKLFLKFWEEYDVNKFVDISEIDLIPDLQNKIRQLVIQ